VPVRPDKAGASVVGKAPIEVTFVGLRDDAVALSCLATVNRQRKRPLALAQKGDGEYQIVIEKKRPGYQVRVERMGIALTTARALHDYEICIAAATVARDAIADE